MSNVQPYLVFGGTCEEALGFYQEVLGAEVHMLMRFSDSPESDPDWTVPPGFENKVMHTSFSVAGTPLMASDGMQEGTSFSGFSLSLTLASSDEATRVFDALAAGGEVTMPLAKTFWSPCFGMLTDRFGVSWMINVEESGGPTA